MSIAEKSDVINADKKEKKIPLNLFVVEERCYVEPFEEETIFIAPPRVSGKCTGCKLCEAICSMTHFGIVDPSLSSIHVLSMEDDWVKERSTKIIERNVCRQCKGITPCMVVCPMLEKGALYRDRKTKAVLVNYDVCIRCQRCIEACPYDAITYSEKMDRMIKCDLCGGEPKCVEWCPPQLLRYSMK